MSCNQKRTNKSLSNLRVFLSRRHRDLLVYCALVGVLVYGVNASAQTAKNVLYFGNSFTNATCCGSSESVPNLVRDIAVAAGLPTPQQRNASSNGRSLQWHIDNNLNRIQIPGNQKWDFVVLQDLSTNPTRIGNLPEHLSSTLELYQEVANHSPDVIPVLYETWARGPGHSFYTGSSPAFPGGPAQMQQELRDGYEQSTANINSTVGSNLARLARAGDAWESTGFRLDLYGSDIYHASNHGTLLNALVIYGTIFEDSTTSDIDISSIAQSLNISNADAAYLTGIADGVLAVPEPSSIAALSLGLMFILTRRQRLSATDDRRR